MNRAQIILVCIGVAAFGVYLLVNYRLDKRSKQITDAFLRNLDESHARILEKREDDPQNLMEKP